MQKIIIFLYLSLLSSCTIKRDCSFLILNEDGSPAQDACIIRFYIPPDLSIIPFFHDLGYYSPEEYPFFAKFTNRNGICGFNPIPKKVLYNTIYQIISPSYNYIKTVHIEYFNSNPPEESYVKNRTPNFIVKFNKEDYVKPPDEITTPIKCEPEDRKKFDLFIHNFNLKNRHKQ